MENWSNEEKIMLVRNACRDINLVGHEKSLDYFQIRFTEFLKSFYIRVREEELKLLRRGRYDLNSYMLSLGTDEFENPYSDYYRTLSDLRGKEFRNAPYIVFRDMYEALKIVLNEMRIQIPAHKFFCELVEVCFNRLGFNVKIEGFGGNITYQDYLLFGSNANSMFNSYINNSVFRIDLASRLNKFSREYWDYGMKLAHQLDEGFGGTVYVDANAEKEFIYKKIQEFRPTGECEKTRVMRLPY